MITEVPETKRIINDPNSLSKLISFSIIIVDPHYDRDVNEEIDRQYLYLTDDEGYLKVWDFTHIVKQTCLSQVPIYKSNKINYTPKRKEQVDASIVAEAIRKE